MTEPGPAAADTGALAAPDGGVDSRSAREGMQGFVRRMVTADWSSAMLALIVLFVVVGVFHPEFLDPGNLLNLVQQSVYVAVMAAGLVFLLTQTEVDLSVGGNYVLASVTAALLMQQGIPPWVAAGLALVAAVAVGALNAFICQVIKIPSLIATLAMGWVLFGLSAALSEGKQIVGLPIQDSFFEILGGAHVFGIPVSVIVLVAIVAILTVVLRLTPFGFRVREIGSNPEAAAFSGIPVRRVKSAAFMLSGLLAGVAGMLGLAFFTSGDPTTGRGYELFAVAGAVIGGNPLSGGTATVFGAALGAILLSAVSVGLVYFNIPASWSQFATGAVILAAVSLDGLVRSRRRSASNG